MLSRQILVILVLFGFFGAFSVLKFEAKAFPAGDNGLSELYSIELGENEAAFVFLGYSGVIVRAGGRTIIIDPAGAIKTEDLDALKQGGVDLLLYTHGHGDHFIPYFAKEIFESGGAVVAANPALIPELSDYIPSEKLKKVIAGESYNFDGIELDVIEGIHVGYITLFRITVGDIRIFHGGDSAYVSLKKYPSDLVFLPTGNPSPTASPEDAFRMASDLKSSVAVAFHGSSGQSSEFRSLMAEKLPKTTVIIAKERSVQKVILR
jgi:L-ascorbate metabolism protein UlaG (beta-lactamase superfamily)